MGLRLPTTTVCCWHSDEGFAAATAALVRAAVRNDPDTQDAAERAAQVRRLTELAGG